MKTMRPVIFLVFAVFLGLAFAGCNLGAWPPATESTLSPDNPSLVTVNLAGPELGTTMRWFDNSLLVYVPQGEFIMGGAGDNNSEYTVTLNAYWIYRNKVTNDMYRLCVATGVCAPPAQDKEFLKYTEPAFKDRPVVGVNWGQAQAYCEWMNARLPTEAEWEKTARGEDGNLYPWGEARPTCDLANFQNCVGRTTDVLDYPEGMSFYKAFDMAGSAQEWTADWYLANYYNESPAENPLGPDSGEVRSVRGSSFLSNAEDLSSSKRSFLAPDMYRTDLGFRCVVNGDAFAPFCETTAYILDESTGAAGEPETCIPPAPEITSEISHCDPGSQTADSKVNFSPPGGPNVLYAILVSGNGCTQEYYNPPDQFGCDGPVGTTYSIEICTQCPWEKVEAPSCDPGYLFIVPTGICRYEGLPVNVPSDCGMGMYYDAALQSCVPFTPTSDQCASGYAYDSQLNCCQAEVVPSDGGNDYPVCPPGWNYTTDNQNHGFCINSPQVKDCETFEIQLPSCAPTPTCTNPKQYDNKPACEGGGCNWKCGQDCTQDCTTDPFTGARTCQETCEQSCECKP